MLDITYDDFSTDELFQKIKGNEIGGIVSFIRVVRGKSNGNDVEKLDIQVSEEAFKAHRHTLEETKKWRKHGKKKFTLKKSRELKVKKW